MTFGRNSPIVCEPAVRAVKMQSMTPPQFEDVFALDDLPNGGRRVLTIDGASILCVRINDEIRAVENACTHLGYPMERGRLIGRQLSCPAHGACFDLVSGRALSGPAVTPLRVYEAQVVAGRVLILIARP